MQRGSKKFLFSAILITIAAVVLIGYIFASQKSEPEYRSKIDRIMFDNKNKSPKFILTLPDKNEKKKPSAEKKIEKKQIETVDDLLNSVPLLSKISPLDGLIPLPIVEILDGNCDREGSFILPKIADNGIKPWVIYGKTEKVQPNFNKVAILIKNVGLDAIATETIINSLPSNISLSFSPYTPDAAQKVKEARKKGHETYADLLLPSKNVLKSDNGPLAMSLTVPMEENIIRIRTTLSINAPFGGMVISKGVADQDNKDQLVTILNRLKNRGLLVLDATDNSEIADITPPGLAHKKAEIVIEDNLSPYNIHKQLATAEKIALDTGQVLIIAVPKPIVINALNDWIKTFSPQMTYEQIKETNAVIEKPLALVPVSNMVVE